MLLTSARFPERADLKQVFGMQTYNTEATNYDFALITLKSAANPVSTRPASPDPHLSSLLLTCYMLMQLYP